METKELIVRCPAFQDGAEIPEKYTGYGQNISPTFKLDGLSRMGKSIAITLDDVSHPLFPQYNHWIIWNIPMQDVIWENVKPGAIVDELGGAIQGKAYGKHCYQGPKPPLNRCHEYVFTVYVLDTVVSLSAKSNKMDFFKEAKEHVIQMATIKGTYQRHKK